MEENLVVGMNNKDNRVFMSQNYQSDSCALEICSSKLCFLGKITCFKNIKFPRGNYQPIHVVALQKHSYCLLINRNRG